MLYSGENDGYVPIARDSGHGGRPEIRQHADRYYIYPALQKYLGLPEWEYRQDEDRIFEQTMAAAGCPSHDLSAGFNWMRSFAANAAPDRFSISVGDPASNPPQRNTLSAIGRSSNLAEASMFVEAGNVDYGEFQLMGPHTLRPRFLYSYSGQFGDRRETYLADRHDGRMNMLFFDGHVETTRREDLPEPPANDESDFWTRADP
jgi:prepilin-type processing-associated H-X9-DG protein